MRGLSAFRSGRGLPRLTLKAETRMTNVDSDLGAWRDSSMRHPGPVTPETVLAAQKRSLELVVRGAPVEDVLADLVRVVEDSSGDALVAILIVDAHSRFRIATAPSLPEPFKEAIDGLDAEALGAFGVAAATGLTALTQDIADNANWSCLPLAEALGLKAAWSHPIVTKENRVLGAFVVYFGERRHPSGFELRLVETLSQTAALAIERHETEAAMARQRRTLDLAMEAAEMGTWRYTFADNICVYDERSQRLYGLSDGRFLHDPEGVKRVFHPEDLQPMWNAVKAACHLDNGRYDVEYRARQPDGSWRWLSAWGIVEFEGEGEARRPVAIAGSSRDITKLKVAEEHQALLINELNHRVKNTLTAVQAIAHQTLRNDGHVQTMRDALDARLTSLARAHDLLTAQKWSGADLGDVVARAIEPFSPARFHVSGPRLFLSSKQALAIAMALHELATNAAKYGALSVPSGRVAIVWSVGGSMEGLTLIFNWQERGKGPAQPPKRRGFGSRLLELGVARELGGTAKLEFGPDGVRWEATAAL